MQGPKFDPKEVGRLQTNANLTSGIQGAWLNNTNQVTPWGTSTYKQTGTQKYKDPDGNEYEIPQFTQSVELSAGQQGLANQQQAAGSRMNQAALGRLNSGAFDTNFDGSQDRQRVEQALMERMAPQHRQDEASARSRLANSGLTEGSEAYNNELARLDRSRGDDRLGAILAGGQEQSRQADLRSRSLAEVQSMLQGGQPQVPQFQQPFRQGVATTPIGEYETESFKQQQASYQNMLQGLFGLGGSLVKGAFALSDRRAKTDIKRVGRTDAGTPIYSYRYKSGGPAMFGVMAQDIEKSQPATVMTIDGVKHVDYSRVA